VLAGIARDAARRGRDISTDKLQHPQRVLHTLVAPCVARHDGDPERRCLRRLQQDHHRHLVRVRGTRSVFVDQDESSFSVRGRHPSRDQKHRARQLHRPVILKHAHAAMNLLLPRRVLLGAGRSRLAATRAVFANW
jgi:hypothetical protein